MIAAPSAAVFKADTASTVLFGSRTEATAADSVLDNPTSSPQQSLMVLNVAQALVGLMPGQVASWEGFDVDPDEELLALMDLSAPNYHSPICLAVAFLRLTQCGARHDALHLLHAAANAALEIEAADQRHGLLEAALLGAAFKPLRKRLAAGGWDQAGPINRALIVISNRMTKGANSHPSPPTSSTLIPVARSLAALIACLF